MYLHTMVERCFNGRKDTERTYVPDFNFQLQATFGPVILGLRGYLG